MNKIIRNLILGFILISVLFILINSAYAATDTGTYISEPIGEENVSGFKTFEIIEQYKPSNTDIKYSFTGSKDNYTNWNEEVVLDNSYDLSVLEELKGSNYVKVKITMVSETKDLTPLIKGFKITYEKNDGNAVITKTQTVDSQSNTPVTKLVATGGNLWFNILLALTFTIIIAFFIFRKQKKSI